MKGGERRERLLPAGSAGATPVERAVHETPFRLEPHALGELLDVSLEVLRQRFLALIGVASSLMMLDLLGGEVLRELYLRGARPGSAREALVEMAVLGLRMLLSLSIAACAGRIAYATLEGRPLGLGELLRFLLRRLVPLLATVLCVALALFLGLLALVLPALVLYWKLFFAPTVSVLEECGPLEAIRRSFALTRGMLLLWMAALIFGFLLFLPFHGAGGLDEPRYRAEILEALGIDPANVVARWSSVLVGTALASIGAAYAAVLSTVLYVEARIRREGFDLLLELARLRAAVPATLVPEPALGQPNAGPPEGLA